MNMLRAYVVSSFFPKTILRALMSTGFSLPLRCPCYVMILLLVHRRKATIENAASAAAAVGAGGVDLWTLEEPTWWYMIGLLALQVVSREVLKRWGPFKSDAALMAHQVGTTKW